MGKIPTGRELLSADQAKYLEFLVDPDPTKPSIEQWCKDNGISSRTARFWKKEKYFIHAWEDRSYEIRGGPDRVEAVVDAIYQKAIGGDTRAAQLYLQYVDKFTPKREVVNRNENLRELSDEELTALGDNIEALRKRKSG